MHNHRLFSRNRAFIVGCLLAPLLLYVIWSALQTTSERNRSYELISQVNEIQWRSSQVREEILLIDSRLTQATLIDGRELDAEIAKRALYLKVNISALLTQPFLVHLISPTEIETLEKLIAIIDVQIIPQIREKNPNYQQMHGHLNEIMPEVRRITTLANIVSYVKTRTAEQAKDSSLTNFTTALFIAITVVVVWWLFLTYTAKAHYNDQVRQFAVLFSHMTVTRINGINLWIHDFLSADEKPDQALLDKARQRVRYLTEMTQWLSRIAYPNFEAETSAYVPLKSVISDVSQSMKEPRPDFVADELTGLINVSQAHYHLIVQELVSNAQDALVIAKSPKITIEAWIRRRLFQPDMLCVCVMDNGLGISPEMQSKITAPFFSTKGEISGHSGLGLYGCIQLVKSMKGKFKINSEVSVGTRMQFCCPIIKNAQKVTEWETYQKRRP